MKLCTHCTTQNPDDALFCDRCGAAFPKPPRTYDYPKDVITRVEDHKPSSKAWMALGIGMFSMASVFFAPVCAPLPGLFAIFLGNSELRKLKGKDLYSEKGERFATLAVWAGWISTTIGLLMILLGITVTAWFFQWFLDVFRFSHPN